MNQTKTRILCLLLAALMLLSLTACGKEKASDAPNHIVLSDFELRYKSAYITKDLDGNDAVVLTLDFTNNSGSDASYFWSVFETATQDGETLEGALILTDPSTYTTMPEDQEVKIAPGETAEIRTGFVLKNATGTVDVNFQGMEDSKGGGVSVDLSTLEHVAPLGFTTNEELLGWWNGEWYGWWMMTESTGIFENLDGFWWDICADIEIEEDKYGTVTLWDEDWSRDNPMAHVLARLSEDGLGEHGTMYSESGWFMDAEITSDSWTVDPALTGMFDGYENVLCIGGYYEVGEDSFTYTIYLRPWGQLWDDIAAEYPDDIPWFYDDWYLPLINAGKTMPDEINEIVPDEGYGLSNPEATGDASLEDMRAVLSILVGWDTDCDYAKAREMLGSDGVPWRELETTWNTKKHSYMWENADGDFLCISFTVYDGEEVYSSCTYSTSVSDGII